VAPHPLLNNTDDLWQNYVRHLCKFPKQDTGRETMLFMHTNRLKSVQLHSLSSSSEVVIIINNCISLQLLDEIINREVNVIYMSTH